MPPTPTRPILSAKARPPNMRISTSVHNRLFAWDYYKGTPRPPGVPNDHKGTKSDMRPFTSIGAERIGSPLCRVVSQETVASSPYGPDRGRCLRPVIETFVSREGDTT